MDNEEWTKEFERTFPPQPIKQTARASLGVATSYDELKAHISQLLTKTRQEERERVVDELIRYAQDTTEPFLMKKVGEPLERGYVWSAITALVNTLEQLRRK